MLTVKTELLEALRQALEHLMPGAGAQCAFESPKVAAHGDLATTVAIQQQDHQRFRSLLEQALAVDVNTAVDQRLANAVAQDKAMWYLANIDRFFILEESNTP